MSDAAESPAPGLGSRIRTARGALSRPEIAIRLDTTEQTLGRYERGERVPDADFLKLMADRLGISPTWLVLGTGPMRLDEAVSAGTAFNRELMRDCIIAADELQREMGSPLGDVEKAAFVVAFYELELEERSKGGTASPGQVIRLFRQSA